MIHDVRPRKVHRIKVPLGTKHHPVVKRTLQQYAADTGQDQFIIVETGLNLIPGFHRRLRENMKQYDSKQHQTQNEVDILVKQIRNDVQGV